MCRDIIVELNVSKGDTLESLAEMYHIPFEKMYAANEGMPVHAPTAGMASLLWLLHELIADRTSTTCSIPTMMRRVAANAFMGVQGMPA